MFEAMSLAIERRPSSGCAIYSRTASDDQSPWRVMSSTEAPHLKPKSRDGASIQTQRQRRARNHAARRPNYFKICLSKMLRGSAPILKHLPTG